MNNDYKDASPEEKKRWASWNLVVERGLKKSYAGVAEGVRTKNKDEDGAAVIDYSKRAGELKAIAARRAKNKLAKASRKANR